MPNSKRSKLTLGVRLAALGSLLMLSLTITLTLISIRREQEQFRASAEQDAHLLLDTLARTIPDDLYRQDIDELDEVADVLSDDPDIQRVYIYDSRGFLLVDSELPAPVLSREADPLGLRLIDLESEELYLDWQSDQFMAARSVVIGRQPLGAIAVVLSTTQLDAQLVEVRNQGIVIAMAIIGVALAISFFAAQQITKPVRNLAGAAAQISAGDYSIRVKRQSSDEVGQLALAFNDMADAVQKRDAELRTFTASLEQQVADRTAELREQNAELVRTNEELILARRRAEEATQLKNQFLANISHELRTPLNSIMGYTQLMLMGIPTPLPDMNKQQVERIMKNSESLLSLINNLLDLAKIEAGRTELIKKPFNMQEWATSVSAPLEVLAEAKGLRFNLCVDSELPESIVGDPDRLRQIVINLAGNAIKFTEKGRVLVTVRNHRAVDRWTITVRDTGIGIPSHAQEFIFEEFRQVDGSATRQYMGTGLGLAIVRSLVVLMNGTIRVRSKVDRGSTFIVSLPMAVEPEQVAKTPII